MASRWRCSRNSGIWGSLEHGRGEARLRPGYVPAEDIPGPERLQEHICSSVRELLYLRALVSQLQSFHLAARC